MVEYLAGQLMLSDEDRFNALKDYFPLAKKEDWRLWQAGQRVQIIKRHGAKGGVLKLGTEIVSSKDGGIAGLLDASPGASTAAPTMLGVLEHVFRDRIATASWQDSIRQIVPSYGTTLNDSPAKVYQEWTYTSDVLQLAAPPQIDLTTTPAAKPGPAAPRPARAAADMAL